MGSVALLVPRFGSTRSEEDFMVDRLVPGRMLRVEYQGEDGEVFVAWSVHIHGVEDDDFEFAIDVLSNDKAMAAANPEKYFVIILGDVKCGSSRWLAPSFR